MLLSLLASTNQTEGENRDMTDQTETARDPRCAHVARSMRPKLRALAAQLDGLADVVNQLSMCPGGRGRPRHARRARCRPGS
jgi:hypothetical protein